MILTYTIPRRNKTTKKKKKREKDKKYGYLFPNVRCSGTTPEKKRKGGGEYFSTLVPTYRLLFPLPLSPNRPFPPPSTPPTLYLIESSSPPSPLHPIKIPVSPTHVPGRLPIITLCERFIVRCEKWIFIHRRADDCKTRVNYDCR